MDKSIKPFLLFRFFLQLLATGSKTITPRNNRNKNRPTVRRAQRAKIYKNAFYKASYSLHKINLCTREIWKNEMNIVIKHLVSISIILQMLNACSSTTIIPTDTTQVASASITNKAVKGEIQLLTNNQVATLTKRLRAKIQRYSKKSNQKSSNIYNRRYRNPEYNENWENKILQAAVCNNPISLLNKGVTGKVLLDVAINADGSVNKITILKSSGIAVLDDAATTIVNSARPFAPLTPDILANTSRYHITRHWDFNCNRKSR